MASEMVLQPHALHSQRRAGSDRWTRVRSPPPGIQPRHAENPWLNAGDGFRRSRAFSPVYLPFSSVVPMILEWSVCAPPRGSPDLQYLRPHDGHDDRLALVSDSLQGRRQRPCLPALPIALCTFVMSTGSLGEMFFRQHRWPCRPCR